MHPIHDDRSVPLRVKLWRVHSSVKKVLSRPLLRYQPETPIDLHLVASPIAT